MYDTFHQIHPTYDDLHHHQPHHIQYNQAAFYPQYPVDSHNTCSLQPVYDHVPVYDHSQPLYDPLAYIPSEGLVPPDIPIHSPIPVSPYSSLLPHVIHADQYNHNAHSPASASSPSSDGTLPTPSLPRVIMLHSPDSAVEEQAQDGTSDSTPQPTSTSANPLDLYGRAPQVTFPTPSELLTDLSGRDANAKVPYPASQAHTLAPSSSSSTPRPHARAQNRSEKSRSKQGSSGEGCGVGPSRSSHKSSRPRPSPLSSVPAKDKQKTSASLASTKPSAARGDNSSQLSPGVAKPENLRKSYFRNVETYIGFKPTDPDTITSHEKKRHYLEGMEQYVQNMHDEFKQRGGTPHTLRRVHSYRGLTTQSIRTMLICLQDEAKELHAELARLQNAQCA